MLKPDILNCMCSRGTKQTNKLLLHAVPSDFYLNNIDCPGKMEVVYTDSDGSKQTTTFAEYSGDLSLPCLPGSDIEIFGNVRDIVWNTRDANCQLSIKNSTSIESIAGNFGALVVVNCPILYTISLQAPSAEEQILQGIHIDNCPWLRDFSLYGQELNWVSFLNIGVDDFTLDFEFSDALRALTVKNIANTGLLDYLIAQIDGMDTAATLYRDPDDDTVFPLVDRAEALEWSIEDISVLE